MVSATVRTGIALSHRRTLALADARRRTTATSASACNCDPRSGPARRKAAHLLAESSDSRSVRSWRLHHLAG
jgi:hypothetical protein